MKKKEIIFFLIIFLLAGAFCIFHFTTHTSSTIVSVSINGTEYKQFDLSKDQNYTIQTSQGYNILQIQNHTATVTEADCPDQICVHQKSIRNTGELIVCLPHKVVIELK
ncbi:NusG domain II-containing protein [Clostridium sp. MD294]|uniref:NusG domain II-containing protein n=1 Tax=Clostridium sp. MD294 TaxID=97138 RepID=UPI0002CBA019|nr:NusG domain II-containing protein [Clostridium sp. MD294]NDO46360.1 NusG domain II-containing protein [Clostridium sp. MD294]USF29213.1 hypothetical protein C820_000598 [Clostridium sp. MD294]